MILRQASRVKRPVRIFAIVAIVVEKVLAGSSSGLSRASNTVLIKINRIEKLSNCEC